MILQTAKRLYFSSIFEVYVVGKEYENHRNKKYNPLQRISLHNRETFDQINCAIVNRYIFLE